ncbi:hypothetical protein EK21DRAFT_115811 [Setomelanomma holmii]|uniref:Uncharacterized protein n=1 Tax=Setomelanomma holmii TaxID=210430 RepID=A0A9P4LH69_9PLEO|nr:hypothetical protein EK21DRAFT_115811 [Setomelanomma holmii]
MHEDILQSPWVQHVLAISRAVGWWLYRKFMAHAVLYLVAVVFVISGIIFEELEREEAAAAKAEKKRQQNLKEERERPEYECCNSKRKSPNAIHIAENDKVFDKGYNKECPRCAKAARKEHDDELQRAEDDFLGGKAEKKAEKNAQRAEKRMAKDMAKKNIRKEKQSGWA